MVIAILQVIGAPTAGASIGVLAHVPWVLLSDQAVLGLFTAASTLVGWVIAFGLWRVRRWAWIAVMLWTGVGLAAGLVLYIKGRPDYWIMVVGIATVFYLNQRDVQEAFQERVAAGESS